MSQQTQLLISVKRNGVAYEYKTMTANILLRILIQWISAGSLLCSTSRSDIKNCKIVETGHEVLVNCSGMTFDDLPKGFPNNVSIIDLTRNSITSIGNMSFPILPELHTLSMYNNKITHLEEGSLKSLPSLTKLDLGKNKLNLTSQALPPGLFENVPLKLLFLTDMDIRESNWCFAEDTFAQLHELEELAIDSPLNPHFGVGFSNMTNLQSLTVRFCQNGSLNESALDVFTKVNLTKLQIYACNKGKIDGKLVAKFPGLDILDIRNAVNNDLAERLINLKNYSNRSMTRISFIANFIIGAGHQCNMLSVFATRHLVTMCVSEVFLASNRITIIAKGALTKEPFSLCLHSLDLSHNMILDEYPLLQTLNMYPNLNSFTFAQTDQDFKLMNVKYPFFNSHSVFQSSDEKMVLPRGNPEQCVFSASSVLKSKGQNSHMDAAVKDPIPTQLPFPQNLSSLYFAPVLTPFDNFLDTLNFSGTQGWKTLVFANCSVQANDVRIMGLENLQELHISGNGFTEPPKALLKSFRNLNVLSLNHITVGFNLIIHNMKGIFANLQHLEKLHLLNNGLTDLPPDVENIPNISMIDVSYNLIHQLSVDTRQRLDIVSQQRNLSVNLRGNPLLCGCAYLDFIVWLTETDVRFVESSHYMCRNDGGQMVNMTDIANASLNLWRECISVVCLSFAVCLLFLFFLVLSLSSHIARNVHLLKRWSVKRLGFNFHRYFTYDVLVYYSTKDDYQWVLNAFTQEIEISRDLTLCIPERDFEPGVYTCAEVLDAINNSWKTVIILTEAFLEDELCYFRLSSAVDACENMKSDRFIILYTNAILRHPMPPIINQLLNKDNMLSLESTYQEELWEQLYNRIVSKD
ncbi:toll-like receptor 4 [Haliotis rufescens]|uniref:toll-like receptor 4 n=1 Tax=Haliotis rufescens TaxID=6454 RepID=UPI001EB0354D|nr:toll-like receptor 4 [Haliotis rufescens]